MTVKNVGAELPFRRERAYDADGQRRTGSAVLDRERAEFTGPDREKRLAAHSSEYRDMTRAPE